MIVIDVPDGEHDREREFWQAAVGKTLSGYPEYPEYHGGPLPGQDVVRLLIQRLGGGQARVHLDIHTDDLDAEVARLERLGARRVEQVREWWIMEDPAGLLFCVVPDEAGTLNDGNAQRWD